MPAIAARGGHPGRDGLSTGPVIGISVAGFLLLVVLVLFSLYPQWRKKHACKPSATKFNGLAPLKPSSSSPRPKFPSHPAVMRGFRRHSSRMIRRYDPRTETPFLNTPPTGDTISLPSIKLKRSSPSLRDLTDSDGLFSPNKLQPSRTPIGHRYSFPKTPGTLTEIAAYGTSVKDYGDAENYILALPEPLVLTAKPAGRAPPLTRHLEKFPMPKSASGGSDKLAHPKKLFERLEQIGKEQEIMGNRTQFPYPEIENESEISPITESLSPRRRGDRRKQTKVIDKSSILSTKADVRSTTTGGSVRTHRKRPSWNPFLNSKRPSVSRAGTVTRPKTPVAEIRDYYNRADTDTSNKPWEKPSLRRALTPSTEPLTASASGESVLPTTSTPPTSLPRHFSKLSLLPTPLRPCRHLRLSAETPTPEPRDRGLAPSSAALLESPDKLAPLHKVLKSKRSHRRSVGFYHTGRSSQSSMKVNSSAKTLSTIRPRPAHLSLADSFHVQFSPLSRRHSIASATGLLSPSLANNHFRQASSVYSRDTKGLSIARSPISPIFSKDATIAEEVVKNTGMSLKRANSFDPIRSKIDNWDLHTGDLRLSTTPSLLKRALSDGGSRSPGFPVVRAVPIADQDQSTDIIPHELRSVLAKKRLGISVPQIKIGRSSDDIFRDDGRWSEDTTRVLKQVIDREITNSESNLSSVLGRGTAPGGAEWI